MKKFTKLIACIMTVVMVLTGVTVANVFAGQASTTKTNSHSVGQCTSVSNTTTPEECSCQYKFSGTMQKGSVSLRVNGRGHSHSWSGNKTYSIPCSVCGFRKTTNAVSINCGQSSNKRHSWGISSAETQMHTSTTVGKAPSCSCNYKVTGNMTKGSISLYVKGQKHTHSWTSNKTFSTPCKTCGFVKNQNSVSFRCGSNTGVSHGWNISQSQNTHTTTATGTNRSCSCGLKTSGNMTKGSISLYIRGQKHTHSWTNGKTYKTPCKTCGFVKTNNTVSVKCGTSTHGWTTSRSVSNNYSSSISTNVSTSKKISICSCQFSISGNMTEGSMSLYVKGQKHTHSWTNETHFNTPCKTCGFTKTNKSISVNCGRGISTKHGYNESYSSNNQTTNSTSQTVGMSVGSSLPTMFNCNICNRYHCNIQNISESTSVNSSTSWGSTTSISKGYTESMGTSYSSGTSCSVGQSTSQSNTVGTSIGTGWWSTTSSSKDYTESMGTSYSSGTSCGVNESTSQSNTVGTSNLTSTNSSVNNWSSSAEVRLHYCTYCRMYHCRNYSISNNAISQCSDCGLSSFECICSQKCKNSGCYRYLANCGCDLTEHKCDPDKSYSHSHGYSTSNSISSSHSISTSQNTSTTNSSSKKDN